MISETNLTYAALLLIPGLLVAYPLLRIVKQFFYNRKVKAAGGVHAPASSNNPFTVLKFMLDMANALRKNKLLENYNEGIDEYATVACPNCMELNFTGGQRYIITREPEHIKTVLTGKFADYGKGAEFHDLWSPFLGDSIFTTDGKQWSNSRNLIRPMFIKNRVSDLEIFERRTQTMMGLFPCAGETFDLMNLLYRLTIDVTTEFLLGQSINSLEYPKGDFVDAFEEVQRIQMLITTIGPLHHFYPRNVYKRGIAAIDNFVLPFVLKALDLPEDELHKLSRSERSFTFLHSLALFTRDPKVIRDQIIAVLLAGRDTTASTLSWTFYELAHYPKIYAKLRAEILATLGEDGIPTYDNLKNMKYLRNTVNETLRLYPAVPFNMRSALADTTLPTGGGPNGDLPITVLKNDLVIYSTLAMQRRKDLYPPVSDNFAEPAIFSPERWESWQPKPWMYVPFNGGPRICIGQNFALAEISYVVAKMVQKYERMEYVGDWAGQEYRTEIVGRPDQGVPVRFFEPASKMQ
ncbi:hypothetical protein AJ78_06172 [Emergomyces pasteurianus Ep9510]|uniref:Cytochrome P450 alkane hydroxylase n=1 Tax=Emergomyces pasteurianus Ep9510 TaxID=1447872 RepID=A0A1J9PA23_9EURO|nr:hypothetical protein AJ78_06172 [Emergomyces pasteurianus Ep9510]